MYHGKMAHCFREDNPWCQSVMVHGSRVFDHKLVIEPSHPGFIKGQNSWCFRIVDHEFMTKIQIRESQKEWPHKVRIVDHKFMLKIQIRENQKEWPHTVRILDRKFILKIQIRERHKEWSYRRFSWYISLNYLKLTAIEVHGIKFLRCLRENRL